MGKGRDGANMFRVGPLEAVYIHAVYVITFATFSCIIEVEVNYLRQRSAFPANHRYSVCLLVNLIHKEI